MAHSTKLVLVCVAMMLMSLVQSQDVTVSIFYVNDLKYDIFPVKEDNSTSCDPEEGCFGGLLRLKDAVDKTVAASTASNTTLLWLNPGHVCDGDAFDALKFSVAAAMNNIGFNALGLEPEVFRYGVEPTSSYLEPLTHMVLAANIKSGVEGVMKSKLVPVLNTNCTLVLIGFVDKKGMEAMKVHGVDVEDEKKAVEAEIAAVKAAHKSKGHVFVGLGSSSVETATLLAGIPDLDIVLFSGGDFTDLESKSVLYFEPVNVTLGEGVYKTNYVASLVKNFSDLEKRFLFGNLELYLNAATCKLTATPGHGVGDYRNSSESTNQTLVKFVQSELHTWNGLDDTIVKSKVNLLPSADACKIGECSLGNLITDAIVEKCNDLTPDKPWEESVKLAVFPAFLIQNRNKKNVTGNITAGQLYNFFAEDEYIYTVALTGRLMRKIFEESLKKNDEKSPVMENFLQVSASLKVEFEVDHPRVSSIQTMSDDLTLTDVALDDDVKEYVVGVARSMLVDGVYAELLKDAKPTFYAATVVDALMEQVTKGGGSLTLSPISTRLTTTVHAAIPSCSKDVAEVVILTLGSVVLIGVGLLVVWKCLWPRYRHRRGFEQI